MDRTLSQVQSLGGGRNPLPRPGELGPHPFIQWGRNQEVYKDIYTRRVSRDYLYAGLRAECLLDTSSTREKFREGWQFLPEIHGSAHYITYLRSRYFGWGGDIDLDFEVLRWYPFTIFFYTDLYFNTKKGDFGPDKVTYDLQYGLTYTREPYFIEGFVEQSKRLDTNRFRGLAERTHLAGLRLGTQAMKPGHYNDGISFSGPHYFQWLHNFNAQASASHYFQNRDWKYLWNLGIQVFWDIFRWYFLVPYLQGEISWLAGGGRTDDALEYAVETGFRLHGVLDVNFYYRFQHQENGLFFRGPGENQSYIGIRALF
jgi:hypothetical protein